MLEFVAAAIVAVTWAAPAGTGADACEGRGEGPYRVVELRRADASLVLFGARHRTDPDDPILAEVEKRVSALAPTVVLVEGADAPAEPTREAAIRRGGEMGGEGHACDLREALERLWSGAGER